MKNCLCPALAAVIILLAAPGSAWNFSVSVSGNTITVNVSGMDNSKTQETCAGASVDTPPASASCGVPGLSYASIPLGCNRIGAHTVFVNVFDSTTGGTYEMRSTSVAVADPPDPTCAQFALVAKTSVVLTHKFGPEAWPTGQQRDAQVELLFKPIQVDAATTMYMKVTDPKDPSSYRTRAPATNDNIDSAAGRLALSPSDTGAHTLAFSAGSDPVTSIYLNTTGFAAGDNYTVQLSADPRLFTDPTFVCSAGCVAVGPITAWKRVYLEKHQMYRSGVLIVGSAEAGSNQVLVQPPVGLRWHDVALKPGDSIRLLHAPRFDGLSFLPDFHSEDAVIAAVDRVSGSRNQRLLTLIGNLTQSYSDDPSYATTFDDGVSDGVGNVAAGLYGRNEAYLNSGFDPAFVQFWTVPQGVNEIPYLPVVRRPNHVANKWFENSPVNLLTLGRPGNSNVKHVLAGSGLPDTSTTRLIVDAHTFGETGIDYVVPPPISDFIHQPNYSWTWVGGIERAVGQHGNPYEHVDPWIFNGHNLVHELAHTFNVNSIYYFGTDYGHCEHTMASNPSLGCTMRSTDDPAYVPAQVGLGIVGFHYVNDNDSEYMTIREAPEPLDIPIR